MVPPSSHRVPRVRQYSGSSFAALAFCLRDFHTVSLVFPYHSAKHKHTTFAVLTPKIFLFLVWPLPLSLATTHRISFDFFSSPYLDVSVQAVPHHTLWIGVWFLRYCRRGFPHSDISGSMLICSSPKLFAAYHVLHRLLMPRHSPCALFSLTYELSRVLSQPNR